MKDNLRKSLGERIKEIRIIKGLSQRQLGSILGMGNSTISAVERGERNLTIDMLQRISDALEIDVISLFEFDNGEHAAPEIIKEAEEEYSIPKSYVSAFECFYTNGVRFKNIEDYYYIYIFMKALSSKIDR